MNNNKLILGTLAKREIDGVQVCKVNAVGHIQYYVKPILDVYDTSDDVNYAAYISSVCDRTIYDPGSRMDEEDREYEVLNQLEDYFFIIDELKTNGDFTNIGNTYTKRKPEKYKAEKPYTAIPVFMSAKDREATEWCKRTGWINENRYYSLEKLAAKIKENEALGAIYGIDYDSKLPNFVLWKKEDGDIVAVGPLSSVSIEVNGRPQYSADKLFQVNIGVELPQLVYSSYVDPFLSFLPFDICDQIDMRLNDSFGERIEIGLPGEDDTSDIMTEIVKTLKEYSSQDAVADNTTGSDPVINATVYYANKYGLNYDRADIVDFHTAMKCGNIVILSGLSGTGKSSLTRVYAEALGITGYDGFLSIPVRPSWNDDSDLLGFPDMMHKVYKPADNGFIDFLVNSARPENRDKMYIVCFDEMNLARVEHYFSQFLSILERPEGQRVLKLYDKKIESELANSDEYPAEINIGNNIRFVGTVNVDDSTHHFSDKVLDRVDVIELDIVDYSKAAAKMIIYEPEYDVITCKMYSGTVREPAADKMPEISKLLWDIHMLLRSSGSGLGVGPRIASGIRRYMNNIPAGEKNVYTYSKALDNQIVQRVLTKLHGPENKMKLIFDESEDNNIMNIFDRYSDFSDFARCRQIVEKKKKELEDYGYCI